MTPENTTEFEKASLFERAYGAVKIAAKVLRGNEAKGDPVFPRGFSSTWMDSWGRPLSISFPGSQINFSSEVGELTTSSLVMAIVNFIATMMAEAPPEMVRFDKANKAEVVQDHALTKLLLNPNPFYQFTDLMKSLVLSLMVGGNNYWLKQRDPKNYLQVNGLWYLPHFVTYPRWDRDDPTDFISSYRYVVDGKRIDYLAEDVVHMRMIPNPHNTRLGMGVFDSVIEEIYGDKKAANFAAVLFKNLGVVQYVITPPKPTQGTESLGLALFGKDPEKARAKAMEIQDSFIRATTGDNAGKPVVNTIPLEITKLSFSPQELDMKELRKVPESRVAGVSGVPAAVVQFLVGLENGTSYASYKEAREQGYEQVVMPLQQIVAAAINKYLVPEFPDPNGARQEFRFNTTNVRVLQDDQNKLFERWTRAVTAGFAQVADARAATGLDVTDADRVYLRSAALDVVPADENAAKAIVEMEETLAGLRPAPPPPPNLLPPGDGGDGLAPDNSDLTADGETEVAGMQFLDLIRRQLEAVVSNGHARREKAIARQVIGLLGPAQKKTVEFDGLTLWREPTATEKLISLKAVQDAFDAGQAELEKQLLALREKLMQDAVTGIIKLSPDDYHTLVVSASKKATAEIRDSLQSIYDRGRQLVIEELESQGASGLGDIGDADDLDEEYLDGLAGVTTSRVANDVQARAIGAAAGLALFALSQSDFREELESQLEVSSSAYISGAASEADHMAFGLGRDAEAADRSDFISEVYYSAILDDGTCEPCAEVDGDTGPTPEDIAPAPNPECEGGARCRCIHIYVYDDSSKAKPRRHRRRWAMYKFNPDQPRDEQGRFAAGGGGGESSSSGSTSDVQEASDSDIGQAIEMAEENEGDARYEEMALAVSDAISQDEGVSVAVVRDGDGTLIGAASYRDAGSKGFEIKHIGSIAKGVGSKLVGHIETKARAAGATRVFLISAPAAEGFWRGLGYSETETEGTFEKPLK